MPVFISGFSLSFSLILAIGAQNAFVLRQGLRKEHVLPVVLVCAISDATLIMAGVVGFGAVIEKASWIEPMFRYGGAAFLIFYGARNALSAWRGSAGLGPQDGPTVRLRDTLLVVLALTWLNPHVYLDTFLLLGSVAAQSENRYVFGSGAVTASFVFFFLLGYGSRFLAPLFAKPSTWKILDAVIALVMWGIALKLLLN